MSVIPMSQERRLNRSQQTYYAITYQLEHIQAVAGLRNLTLSDERGLVLACAGNKEEATILAAYASVLAKSSASTQREALVAEIHTLMPRAGRGNIHVRSLWLEGQRLYLCTVGPKSARAQASMLQALTGVRRIFGQSFSEAS